MAAPAATMAVEAGLQPVGQTTESHQRMTTTRLAEGHVQRHAGKQAEAQAHDGSPQWFSNSISASGRSCAQPSSTSIGRG
ncbi:hypothetical protein D3C78_1841210 [compost metagenome]